MNADSPFVIDVKNLCKSFNGVPAVKELNLQIKQGEIFGFLGPNGGGKTTTMRMLCGLLTPNAGEGKCLGYDIIKQSYDIKCNVGYMTQRFSLYEDLTVNENLEFFARIYNVKPVQSKIKEMITTYGFTKRQNQMVGDLSGGWKQRLALTACLLQQPKLLLLDEPTAGVDPKARREFWNHIHELADAGITTLVSTHYMDEAERCTSIGYILEGRLLTHGTKDEVIAASGLHTWSISTKSNLNDVAKLLRAQPEIEQVVFFGQRLHASGYDSDKVEHVIKQKVDADFELTKVAANLEDVFIHLVTREEEVK